MSIGKKLKKKRDFFYGIFFLESADQVQKMIAMAVEAYRKEKKEFEKNLDKLNSDLSEEGKKLIRIKRK